MPNHRNSVYTAKQPGLSFWASVALVGLLVLAISAAAVGLGFTFNPQNISDMPSFWHGTTDVLRTVRMLGSCQ
jgi:hypothetical protein